MLLQTPTSIPDIQIHEFPSPPFWVTMPPEAVTLMVLGVVAGVVIITWPLIRALAKRLEGRQGADAIALAEVEQLRVRMAELEQLSHRMADLEERLDFAERLLSQNREVPRLEGGRN